MQDFDRIYAEYYAEVYKFVLTLCRDAALAEEITQESFFKALKNIDSFHGDCKIGTWLCKIAKNTLYSYTRKQDRQTELLVDGLISEESLEQLFADKETAYA
ncbi:MAG: RNA polymerase sigma factor, partial [Oscillospiraceae bacterium]|nr:RNA polymerase sigma factor [Oscillospiraceae bacterium]